MEACHEGSCTLYWLSLCLAVRLSFLERCWEEARKKQKAKSPNTILCQKYNGNRVGFMRSGGKSNELQACSLNKSGSGSSFHAPVPLLDHRLKERKKMRGAKGNDFFPGTSDHFILLY